MSGFKTGKFYFDKMFNDEWTDTPIHFAGQEFDGAKKNEWINIFFSPLSLLDNGISSNQRMAIANLNVICWANNDVDVMELADAVIVFMDVNNDKATYRVRRTEILDHGWDASNKVYMYVNFMIEYPIGCYNQTVDCSISVGGADGTEFNVAGFLYSSCIIAKA